MDGGWRDWVGSVDGWMSGRMLVLALFNIMLYV